MKRDFNDSKSGSRKGAAETDFLKALSREAAYEILAKELRIDG